MGSISNNMNILSSEKHSGTLSRKRLASGRRNSTKGGINEHNYMNNLVYLGRSNSRQRKPFVNKQRHSVDLTMSNRLSSSSLKRSNISSNLAISSNFKLSSERPS